MLALSTRSRGAVWNRETGEAELRLPGFEQASWGTDGKLYLQFPKQPKQDRKVFAVDVTRPAAKSALRDDPKLANEAGALKHKDNARLIEAVDAKTGALLGRVVIDLPGDYAGADGLNSRG